MEKIMPNPDEECPEIYVEDHCPQKKFFSQIPNIIHKMGLGPYVVAYYCLLKSIAGDSRSCFKNQKSLAEELGCSDRQLRKLNNFMSQPFQILNGKPLIQITRRKREDGGCMTNLIILTDIWMENVMVLKDKKPIPKTPLPREEAKIKEINIAERHSGTSESGAYKEEPLFKKNKDLGLGTLETLAFKKAKRETLDASRRWGLTPEQNETFESLKSLGIDAEEKKLCYWAKKYPLERLLAVYNEAKHCKAISLRKFMSSLLDANKVVPSANCESNRKFAENFLKANHYPSVKMYKNYLKIPFGRDYKEIDFNMAPADFAKRIIELLGETDKTQHLTEEISLALQYNDQLHMLAEKINGHLIKSLYDENTELIRSGVIKIPMGSDKIEQLSLNAHDFKKEIKIHLQKIRTINENQK